MSANPRKLEWLLEMRAVMEKELKGLATWVKSSGYHYPLPTLEVGESLMVPYAGRTYKQVDQSIRSCVYRAKRHGMRFEKTRSDVGIPSQADRVMERIELWGRRYVVVWSLKQWQYSDAEQSLPKESCATTCAESEKPVTPPKGRTTSRHSGRTGPKGKQCKYPEWMLKKLEEVYGKELR